MFGDELKIIPITRDVAKQFVKNYHRHNKPVVGYKFAIGLKIGDELVGVGIAGRPVARALDNGETIEILRVCVKDGIPNGCSKLYARLVKISELMGYKSVITYTLPEESKSSLKAIGGKIVAETRAESWFRVNRPRGDQDIYNQSKIRWELTNNVK